MYEQLNIFDYAVTLEKPKKRTVVIGEIDEQLVPCIRCGNDPIVENEYNNLGWEFQYAICPACGYKMFGTSWNYAQESRLERYKRLGRWLTRITPEQKARQIRPFKENSENT